MKDGSGALVDTANEAPRSLLAGDQPILLMQEISTGFEWMFCFLHFCVAVEAFLEERDGWFL
jgi:hypothetical protein